MPRRLVATLLAGLVLAGAGASGACAMKKHRPLRSTELPRPLNGDVAVRAELDAARRAGTVEAYDLFLRRHGDHALAQVARRERAALVAPRP